MSSPSATLTTWAAAWLAGACAPDDVLDAVGAWAPMHLVGARDDVTAGRTGLPWPDPSDTAIATLLKTIRSAASGPDAELRLVLPVPGDVRGLPTGTDFAIAATDAGEGVLLGVPGAVGTGVVPQVVGPDVLQWTVFSTPIPIEAPVDIGLGEAEYAMRNAVREAADALAALHRVALERRDFDAREAIEDQLAEFAVHGYPHSIPQRAQRILQSADHVAAILTVAENSAVSTPATMSAGHGQEGALRPLWNAVRTARLAAINAPGRIG